MNIKVTDLQEFSKFSSPLKGHENILPILEYIKVGNGKIVKTVLSSFVEFDCEDADKEMLLDEKRLSTNVKAAETGFLSFKKKDNKVTITDSITPDTFQVPEVNLFPSIPSPTSERYPVSKNFMSVLKKASSFSLPPNYSNLSWMSFVMVGKGYVCGSDGVIIYTEPIDEQFEMLLDKDDAATLSKLDITEFAENEKYMFFYGKGVTLGFSKIDLFKFMDIISYGDYRKGQLEFSASASDIQKFNWRIIQSSEIPFVTITKGKIFRNDSKVDSYQERVMETLTPSSDFVYNAEYMSRLLNAFEKDEVDFYRGKDCYWIVDPNKKFSTLIMRINPDVTK
jgi:hypothetical protein